MMHARLIGRAVDYQDDMNKRRGMERSDGGRFHAATELHSLFEIDR